MPLEFLLCGAHSTMTPPERIRAHQMSREKGNEDSFAYKYECLSFIFSHFFFLLAALPKFDCLLFIFFMHASELCHLYFHLLHHLALNYFDHRLLNSGLCEESMKFPNDFNLFFSLRSRKTREKPMPNVGYRKCSILTIVSRKSKISGQFLKFFERFIG